MSGDRNNTNGKNGRNGRNGHNGHRGRNGEIEKILEFVREFHQAAAEVTQGVGMAFLGLKHAIGEPRIRWGGRNTAAVFTHYACDIVLDSLNEQTRNYTLDVPQRDLYNMHAPHRNGRQALFSLLDTHGIDPVENEIKDRKFKGPTKAANEARMRNNLIREELGLLREQLTSQGIEWKISRGDLKLYIECRADVLTLARKTISTLQLR